MKVVLLAAICGLCICAQAPLPPEYKADAKQFAEWTKQIKTILLRILPEDASVINGMWIHIENDNWANASTNTSSAFGPELYVSTGLLKLLKSEDEYAGILAHEMGHVMLKHKSVIIYVPKATAPSVLLKLVIRHPEETLFVFREEFEEKEDLELLEKQQNEADDFAVRTLRRLGISSCSFADVLHRIESPQKMDPKDPKFLLVKRRAERMDKYCEEEN